VRLIAIGQGGIGSRAIPAIIVSLSSTGRRVEGVFTSQSVLAVTTTLGWVAEAVSGSGCFALAAC